MDLLTCISYKKKFFRNEKDNSNEQHHQSPDDQSLQMMANPSASRRDVLAAAASAAVIAPLLRPARADAAVANLAAPFIEIFDARGCDRLNNKANKEYNGPKAGDENDDMCVKVSLKPVTVSLSAGASFKQEVLSFKNAGANGYGVFPPLEGGLVNSGVNSGVDSGVN